MESGAPEQLGEAELRGPLDIRGRGAPVMILLGTVLIGSLVGGIYAPALHGDWVYDDPVYVARNPHIQPFGWDVVVWSFTEHYQGNWHPITWLSHAVDLTLWSGPFGHHLVNLMLHAVNAALLFMALERMTRCTWRSLAVALLFAAHPIQVESVAWISERKNILCLLFCLASLHAYLSCTTSPPRRRIVPYGLAVVFLTLALMSKQMAVTWPFVLLLLDFWPLRRLGVQAIVEKIPMIVLIGGGALVAWITQHGDQAVTSLSIIGWGARLSNAAMSYVRYLGKLFVPVNLSPYYPYPGMEASAWAPLWVAGAVALLAIITLWVVQQRRRRPYLIVGWLWMTGTLVPVIGLVQIGRQAMADRFAYLPMIGIVMAVVWWVGDWVSARVAHRAPSPTDIPRPVTSRARAIVAAVLIVLSTAGLGAVAHRQISIWQNNESLWRRAIALAPDASRPYRLLAVELASREDAKAHEEAVRLLREAIPREKDLFENSRMRWELSELLSRMERYSEAILELERLVRQAPDSAIYPAFLAFNQERAARKAATDGERTRWLESARQNYLLALTRPSTPAEAADIRGRYANLLEQLGEPDSALTEYREALRDYPTLRNCEAMARLLDRMGRRDEAAQVRQRCAAIRQRQTSPDAGS